MKERKVSDTGLNCLFSLWTLQMIFCCLDTQTLCLISQSDRIMMMSELAGEAAALDEFVLEMRCVSVILPSHLHSIFLPLMSSFLQLYCCLFFWSILHIDESIFPLPPLWNVIEPVLSTATTARS